MLFTPPKFLQPIINKVDAVLRPIPGRYGRIFKEYYDLLEKSQWWTKSELEEYQLSNLKRIIKHAYDNIPYYNRVFKENAIKPEDIKNLEDIKKIPFLNKEIVRKNLSDLIARNVAKKDTEYVTTGGSTAIPVGLFIEKKTNLIRFAFEWRAWNWMDYHFREPCVVLRGRVLKNRISLYDPVNNYLILSAYKMTEDNLKKYLDLINGFRPKIIRAYPSSATVLARYIKEKKIKFNQEGFLKAISTSSENLYDSQRNFLEQAYRCKVFDKYGNSEQATILGECAKHEGYHDFMEYSLTELVDTKGNDIKEEGGSGEIVSTVFTNRAMPLIRYRSEDLATYTNKLCSCGRKLKLYSEIIGRKQEMIITKLGNLITMTALIFATHSPIFKNVKQFQFIQNEPGKLLLKIIKNDSYAREDTNTILQELENKLEKQLTIQLQFVNEIPLTPRGKYRFLIQNLPIDTFENHEK
ncbi:MAG: phenylacetate--CoA ligase family protein [Patescibacteria group bacterium]